MNRRLRAVAIGAITAASTIVVGAVGAGVALAHHNTIVGVATCETSSTYKITWSITNSESISEDITRTSTNVGTFTPDISSTVKLTLTGTQTGQVVQTAIPAGTVSQTLKIHGLWTNLVTSDNEATVGLSFGCTAPVAPKVNQVGTCGVYDNWTTNPVVTGVEWSSSQAGPWADTLTGTFAPGATSVTIYASAKDGYKFPDGTTDPKSYTISQISPVEQCVAPVAPVVTVKTECGAKDTFTAGPTTGVLYSTDGDNYSVSVTGSLNAGNNVGVVKAKADDGYALIAGSPTSFDLTGSAIEKCGDAEHPTVVSTSDCGVLDTFSAGPTLGVLYSADGVNFTATVSGNLPTGQSVTVTAAPDTANGYNFANETFPLTGGIVEVCPIAVTPVPPNVVTPPCGEPATFTTTPVTGVVYSQTSGTLTPGVDTVITVTAGPGYVLAPGAPTSYTLTGPAVVPCAQAQVDPPAPTVPAVIVAPPAPEAPPMGLPETGSNHTGELLLGGFLLLAGASLLGAVRRRTVKVKS